jgi:hypothetical protein
MQVEVDYNALTSRRGAQMTPFEQIRHEDEGVKCWSARELAKVLGYAEWDKFQAVIRQR